MSTFTHLIAKPLNLIVENQEVWLSGKRVRMPRKAFRVLESLMRSPEQLITKEQLIDQVWEGRIVSDTAITTVLGELRQALGESSRVPVFIETVHGRGYKFAKSVEVRTLQSPTPEQSEQNSAVEQPRQVRMTPRWLTAAGLIAVLSIALWFFASGFQPDARPFERLDAVPVDSKTVAVLPFDYLSNEEDEDWLASGVTEQIQNSMARTPSLTLVGQRTSRALTEPGADANGLVDLYDIDFLLSGSVHLSDQTLRVSVQLIDAEVRTQVWADTFERPASELIDVQESIALSIVDALGVALDPEERAIMANMGTSSVEAYRAYLRALSLQASGLRTGNTDREHQAYEELERARELDPGFAAAHYLSAEYWRDRIHSTRIGGGSEDVANAKREFVVRIKDAIEYELNPDRTTYYQALREFEDLRFRQALRLLETYLSANPNDPDGYELYARCALYLGELPAARSAIESFAKLVELSDPPRTPAISLQVHAGRPSQAADLGLRFLERIPDSAFAAYQTHRALLWASRIDEARALLGRVENSDLPLKTRQLASIRQLCADGDSPAANLLTNELLETDSPPGDSAKWLALSVVGRDGEAQSILSPNESDMSLTTLAGFLVYPAFDRNDHPRLQRLLTREDAIPRPVKLPPFRCGE